MPPRRNELGMSILIMAFASIMLAQSTTEGWDTWMVPMRDNVTLQTVVNLPCLVLHAFSGFLLTTFSLKLSMVHTKLTDLPCDHHPASQQAT